MTVGQHSDQAATDTQRLSATAASPQSMSYAARQEQLAARRAGLSIVKQALIDKRLRRESPAHERLSSLPPRSAVQDHVPLSLSQEPLWFQEQLNSGTTIYNISSVEQHVGPFNFAAFEQSVHTLRARHESLRARFVVVNGAPVQVFDPPIFQPLPYFDLRMLPLSEQVAVGRQIAHDVQRPFDLSEHSLLRVAVVQIAEQEHVILLTMHHMVSDGWSMGVLVDELSALYTAFAAGQPSPLAPLPIQYGDFASWQRQWLQSEECTRLLAYWQTQLAGAPQLLTLPTDRPRPARQTYRGSELPVIIPSTLRASVGQFGTEEQATLFMVLLAVFQLLLARLSGQEEIVVGTPVAGRSHPALNGLIGCFVNSLVLRTDLRGNPSFRELVQRVRQVCLDGYAHQDLPFGKLVEALQPTRTLSYSPVFQVMFDLVMVPQRTTAHQPTQSTPIEGQTDTAKYDVVLALSDDGSTLDGSLIYNTDLFDAATIERMRSQFLTLLEAGVAQPDQPIMLLSLLGADEYHRLLVEWNGTRIPSATAASIVDLFTAQAERTPAADAVVAGTERLTYGELHRRSNQLAQYLRSQGVGGNTAGTFGEMLIGICTERSLELAIGLLGILKAGAAYVPLDPAYPADRLAWMVEDAHIQVLLTQAHLKDRLAQVLGQVPERKLQLVCLDQAWSEIARHSGTCPESRIVPEHPAYVIYTSGSTGTPKGVLIPHRALIHHCQVIGRYYAIQPSDRVLQWSALSFDVMAEELFPAWMCGATVVFRSEQLPPTMTAFLDFVVSERLTILNLPTPYWHAWVAALGEASLPWPPDLRLLVVGSDVAHAPQLVEWRRSSGDRVRWLNAYGATETTITATIYEPDQAELVGDRHVVPIGRALANVQAYILDRRLQLLPVGVPGELHIGGAGLARGYLNHQALTAERFIPDPFSDEPGRRLYKTGDLVSWRADGNIEFLGRVDQQIKLRGYRIEPGEIEAVLLSYPAIGKAVVVAINDGLEGNRLVAYVVANQESQAVDATSSVSSTPGSSLSGAVLKHFLQGKLPEYMVPSAFVVLPSLPLAPSGKIDRQALPLLSSVDAAETSAFIVPRDTLEMQLVQIWQSVLGHARISVTDDFFRLGGHSLLAVRLMDMIQRRLGRVIPLSVLFQSPTVERLAQHLRRIPVTQPASPLIPIQSNGSQRPFFCVHPLGGSVFCYAPLMRRLGPDQPGYGLEAIGMSGEQPPHERVEEMAAAYIAAIQTVQPAGPYRLGGWSFGGVVAFEMAQQLQRQGHAVSLLALFDCKAPQFEPEPEMDDKALMSRFVKELGGVLGKTLPKLLRRLQQRRDDQRLQWIWKQLGATGLVPPDVDLAYIEQLFKVFAANERALRRYSPQPSAIPIVLFLARMSFDAPAKVVGSWQQLNDRSIAAHTISGNHFSMLNSPHVDVLAEHLLTYLSEAEVSQTGADAPPSQSLVSQSA